MRYKGYIFDLDDTLYCEHDYVFSGFRAVADELEQKGVPCSSEELQRLFVQEWQQHGRGQVFNQVCHQLNIDINIDYLVQIYREHQPTLALYEDTKVVLSHMHQLNIPMGLITDGLSVMQWNKINALDLRGLFQVIIVTDDLGRECWKPHPLPYLKAMEALNLLPDELVYVGDNPHKDFVQARKLGMHTIRIVRDVGDHMRTRCTDMYEADYIINSMFELIHSAN